MGRETRLRRKQLPEENQGLPDPTAAQTVTRRNSGVVRPDCSRERQARLLMGLGLVGDMFYARWFHTCAPAGLEISQLPLG